MNSIRGLLPHCSERVRSWLLVVPLIITACSLSPSPTPANPSPLDDGAAAPSGSADLTLSVSPPTETPGGGQIVMVLIDEVSGLPFNTKEFPMQHLPDGRWQVVIARPSKSVLHYRYAVRGGMNADEVTTRGRAIRYRTLWLPSKIAVDDQVAAWAGGSYSGPTGRIIGTVVDARSGQPLPEVVISAAGISAFTDGQGGFRLEGLQPGLHTLTAISTDGSTIPFQQGALIAPESATPVRLDLHPASRVQVTFEVEMSTDTTTGMPVRMAGNLRQFGDRFADLPGHTGGAVGRMPELVQVDARHYIMIAELFSGTDLHYKYTLGDGLWNAERDLQGVLTTRQLIVPQSDLVVQDIVESWSTPERGAVTFNVQVPDTGSADTPIGLQFMPSDGFQALPMWRSAENTWSYVLYGPLNSQGALRYRYCRLAGCAGVFPGGSGEAAAGSREVQPAADPFVLNDTVTSWVWQTESSSPTDSLAPEIEPRAGFEAGVELQPDGDPNAIGMFELTLSEIAAGGANAVILTPGWDLGQPNQSPMMAFDPGMSAFAGEITGEVAEAQRLGLRVSLRPTLFASEGDIAKWWEVSARDTAWWNAWFENYRDFILTYARLAAVTGAEKIILGGPEAAPAFPAGDLQDGSPSGAPPDAESRWREIIAGVRGIFPGTVALELDLGDALQPLPPFFNAVDQIHVHWHPPLDTQGGATLVDLRAEAGRWMDEALLGEDQFPDKPIVLSVEYLSVEGGSTVCIRKPDGGCWPASAFSMGRVYDPPLTLDLESQALAYDAVLMEAYTRAPIRGIYARGYNPSLALQDLSASVRGKPAQDVLWNWFPRITGRIAR